MIANLNGQVDELKLKLSVENAHSFRNAINDERNRSAHDFKKCEKSLQESIIECDQLRYALANAEATTRLQQELAESKAHAERVEAAKQAVLDQAAQDKANVEKQMLRFRKETKRLLESLNSELDALSKHDAQLAEQLAERDSQLASLGAKCHAYKSQLEAASAAAPTSTDSATLAVGSL